ncbi:phosphotransferase [Azospirillum sp. RWY-5-1]|uniref:Phosphotransferase n=1 Tax=Azospirillum oleiclasticum TaxID=2735135 RepID=A0ABX2TEU5_9PROT|nr:phosphotransferase [Azospirillum oleiclasticum]NYZ15094.1 phosphotransferase [Azospirillum oleiclasticum]NYZ22856.1 phosphotransferase [Azospirillum oleiclasticum]
MLPLRGVAHDHVRLVGRGLVARVPRWSQVGLDAAANLAHQAAAFRRAEASGRTPRLHRVIAPADGLPMGALLVDEVVGRPPRLPGDMAAIAVALAALHHLPLPPMAARPPLVSPPDPVAAALAQVERQAAAFDAAPLEPRTRALLAAELAALRPSLPDAPVPVALVGSDVHPGNFLIDTAGRAWFTDLEKAQYGHPAIDLAHASLHTSTRWDPQVDAELSPAEVAAFLAAWEAAVPLDLADAVRPWLTPLRRLTWLRTLTWMARWAVEGEALSAGMPAALARHMRRYVEDVFRPEVVERVRADFRTGC